MFYIVFQIFEKFKWIVKFGIKLKNYQLFFLYFELANCEKPENLHSFVRNK